MAREQTDENSEFRVCVEGEPIEAAYKVLIGFHEVSFIVRWDPIMGDMIND